MMTKDRIVKEMIDKIISIEKEYSNPMQVNSNETRSVVVKKIMKSLDEVCKDED